MQTWFDTRRTFIELRLAAGDVPVWLRQCKALLEDSGEVDLDLRPQPSADVVLSLHDDGAPRATDVHDPARPHWLLTDGDGEPLACDFPLLRAITAGRGISMTLWRRDEASAAWLSVRHIHVAARARYGRAVSKLPHVAARLIRQACKDLRLGIALRPQSLASGQALRPIAGAAASTPMVIWHVWRGLFQDWQSQQRARWFREQWTIGVVDAPVSDFLDSEFVPQVHWVDGPSGLGYWADPMGSQSNNNEVFCEYFDERSGLGRVERLGLDASGRVSNRTVLPVGHGMHASFPLIVNLDERRLALAETCARRECVLHEVDDDGNWRPLVTMLRGVAAADPALFVWEGRYWLAVTDVDQGESDNLCLYYADQLEGPWLPHANNPVKVDVTGARMAGGFFRHGGALYRPAQDCLLSYGSAVVMWRIARCTPTEFEEVPVGRLSPDPRGPWPDGIHTVSAWGERTLIDGKRHVFSATASWHKLRRRWLRHIAMPRLGHP